MKVFDREVFDAEEFRVQFDRPEVRDRLIRMFPEEIGRYLERSRKAIEIADADELHLAAHELKGAVGNYLGTRAFSAATELDRLALEGDLAGAREAAEKCEAEVKLLGKALLRFASTDPRPG